MWASAIDRYDDFARNQGTDSAADADRPFTLNLISNRQNRIHWLESSRELVAGTSANCFVISGDLQTGALAPGHYFVYPLKDLGVSQHQPLKTPSGLVYLQRGSRVMRELVDISEDRPDPSRELNLLSEHMAGIGILSYDFQSLSIPIIWQVNQDGLLHGLTHLAEQNVTAAHRHDLGAPVLDVACYSSNSFEDHVFLLVNRAGVKTIERLSLGQINHPNTEASTTWRYLDSWQRHTVAPDTATNLTGASRFGSSPITVTVEAIEMTEKFTQTGGVVELPPTRGGQVLAGLAIESQATTTAGVMNGEAGSSFLRRGQVADFFLDLNRSGEVIVTLASNNNPNDSRRTLNRTQAEILDQLPPLHTGQVYLPGLPNITDKPTITLTAAHTHPVTILALSYNYRTKQR